MKALWKYLLRLELAPSNSYGQATSTIRTKLSEERIALSGGLVITRSATETTMCASMTNLIKSRAEQLLLVFQDLPLDATKKKKN